MHVALVTGSTRNIGLGIALRLAADGMAVAVNGRDAGACEEAAAQLRADHGMALAAPADVTDPEAVEELAARILAELGPIDVLVNNAVRRYQAPVLETDLASWRETLGTQLDAALLCSQAVLPGMRANGWGRIVNIVGVSGQRGAANRVAVVTAKSGLMGLTKALAMETAPEGITVNAVSPGLIDTVRRIPPEQEAVARAHYEREVEQVPMARLGRIEEIAGTVAFLCTDDAAFMTGQTLGVNGGLHLA